MTMISLVVATDEKGLIGKNNQLPWHLPADLKYFKKLTMGNPVIMGRKTYESIGKPLPGRLNIIITRQEGYAHEGIEVACSPEEAIHIARNADEIFIIGGSEIFKATLSVADRIYLTEIHHTFEGDTWFPELNPAKWKKIKTGEHPADEKNQWNCTFWILEKIQ